MGKQRKRGINGSGSVFERQDGRWEAKFKVEETGKYKSFYAPTEKEAYKKLQEALLQQKQGILATGPDQTIQQFLEYWLEDVHKPTVRLNTYIGYRVVIQKHLIPGIGHIKLQKLTVQQLQSFYSKKLKTGTSANRIIRLNAVLHKALSYAKRIKIVGVNVTEDVELPKAEKHKANSFTAEQVQLLLQEARGHGMETLIALAAVVGMRKGEILGLRWSDVDLKQGTIQISRTLNYLAQYGFVEGKPKTKASERRILLPPFIVELLKKHYTAQLEKKSVAGIAWINRDLVFPKNNGDYIVYPTMLRHFYALLDGAGLPRIRFHDLRHSAATILLSKKVPGNMVQELLGHEDISMTLGIYGHVLPSMQKDALDNMENLYGGQS